MVSAYDLFVSCLPTHSGILGYRVGDVKVIFHLPPHIQKHRGDATSTSSHLAYVELYTRFTQPERYSKLYKVRKAMESFQRRAVVIPVDLIYRSCHLIPVFGKDVDRTWTSGTVMDKCSEFYLNTFSDVHMYHLTVE
jgi:hypothetical protein